MLHRARELLVRQRTMLINAIRAHMAEFGIVAPVGVLQVKKLLGIIADTDDARLPSLARTCLESLARQFLSLHDEIHATEKRIHAWHRSNEASRRLETIAIVDDQPEEKQSLVDMNIIAEMLRDRAEMLRDGAPEIANGECNAESPEKLFSSDAMSPLLQAKHPRPITRVQLRPSRTFIPRKQPSLQRKYKRLFCLR